ncbi:hypothetical protein [Nocardia heshunensis]
MRLKQLSLEGRFTHCEAAMRVSPGAGPKLHDTDPATGEIVVSNRLVSAQLSPRDKLTPPCIQLVEAFVELYAERTGADPNVLAHELNALHRIARVHCEEVKADRVEAAIRAGLRAPTYAQLQAKEHTIIELRKKVETCDAELTRLREEVGTLQDARNEQILRIAALADELVQLRRQLDEAVTERNDMLQERDDTITELREIVESREAELTRLRGQVGAFRSGDKQHLRRIKVLTEEIEDLRQQLAVVLDALKRSRGNERQLRRDLERSERRLLRTVAESDQQQARIAELAHHVEDPVERERREHAVQVWQALVTDSDFEDRDQISPARALLKLRGARPRLWMKAEAGAAAAAALGSLWVLGIFWGTALFVAMAIVRCYIYEASVPVVTIRTDDLLISRFYKTRSFDWREIGEVSQVRRHAWARGSGQNPGSGDFRIESRDGNQLAVIRGGLCEWEAFTTLARTLAPHVVLVQGPPSFGRDQRRPFFGGVDHGARNLMLARACVHGLEKDRAIVERHTTWVVQPAPELHMEF